MHAPVLVKQSLKLLNNRMSFTIEQNNGNKTLYCYGMYSSSHNNMMQFQYYICNNPYIVWFISISMQCFCNIYKLICQLRSSDKCLHCVIHEIII